MKNKRFQYLEIYKVSTLFLATGFAVLVFFAPQTLNFRSTEAQVAQHQAERLAQEILQRRMLLEKAPGRNPASSADLESEGQIGLDPWGQPFKYSVLETDRGIARVVVRTQSENSPQDVQASVDSAVGPADAQDLQPEY